MFPLFETICVKNGVMQNVEYHQRRYQDSCFVYFGKKPTNHIAVDIIVPDEYRNGTSKMKIEYNEKERKYSFEHYELGKVKTLKIIEDNTIDYVLKYTNRLVLQELLKKKEDCDEILIVRKGFITDTSFSNIVFFDGINWVTPSSPLLKGTCRERLLNEKKIIENEITIDTMEKFVSFQLINSMRDFNEINEIGIENIIEPVLKDGKKVILGISNCRTCVYLKGFK